MTKKSCTGLKLSKGATILYFYFFQQICNSFERHSIKRVSALILKWMVESLVTRSQSRVADITSAQNFLFLEQNATTTLKQIFAICKPSIGEVLFFLF